MRKGNRGQALVILAILIPVILLLFLFALGLAAFLDARAHVTYALSAATRAGARQVEYTGYGQPGMGFNEQVIKAVQQVFLDGLRLRTTGLGDPPEEIAARTTVVVGYGTIGSPWPSPFVRGRIHTCPTVAAQVAVPIQVWMFEVTVTIVSETEVR